MTDVQNEKASSEVFEKLESRENQKYHYSPVPSNCMACAARRTSRKYEELQLQRSETTLCAPFPSCEDVHNSIDSIVREKYCKTKLHIVTTNRRIKVFGKWSEQKLLAAVTDRLLQRATSAAPCNHRRILPLESRPVSPGVPYDPIIHRGIYSENILRKLYATGAPESVLINAMKFGLRHLKPENLNHFIQFGVSIPVLRSKKLWKEVIDESLSTSLRTMGFDEKCSRRIILNGILAQSQISLMQLMLAGVDIPSILNWQGRTIEVGPRHIQFLRKLNVAEDVLQLIAQKGIDEETNEMLKDLGFTETEQDEHPGMHEVVICECNLTILESDPAAISSRTIDDENSQNSITKLCDSEADVEAEETCACFTSTDSSTPSTSSNLVDCNDVKSSQDSSSTLELLTQRNDYLRRTVMVPLSWAMAKALQYRPSDPKYYIACQLVRWRYGGVSETEMKKVEEFVISRTIAMDERLTEQKLKEEEELIARREAEALENIPCHQCLERQQIHRIKERCWKCIKKWVPNHEPCEFQEICSSCNLNLSHIPTSDSSTTSGAGVPIGSETFKDEKSPIPSYDNRYIQEIESSNYPRCYNGYKESLGSASSVESRISVSSKSVESEN